MGSPIRHVCAGCGYRVPAGEPFPFRCPRGGEGDDADHVLQRVLEPEAVAGGAALFDAAEPNPFLRYRELLCSWHAARAGGMDEGAFAELVAGLDRAVAAVDGREVGFRETPFAPADALGEALGLAPGQLWVKDETGNVAGSHKGRHLMGLMLWLEVAQRTGLAPAETAQRPLAIASCGNAALAAAVVAAAAGRRLEAFVPPHADALLVERIGALGARVVPCHRGGSGGGDPCFHAFVAAVAGGALPFTCQGSTNGLTLEGGATLAWEMVSALRRQGAVLDALFVQVGGGALTSATIQGLREAVALGALPRVPRLHSVQTHGAWPLYRAWDRFVERVLGRVRAGDRERAAVLAQRPAEELADALAWAARHRSSFMWPWEEEPRSVATGILDDETYDWLAVLRGMVETGGWPLIVEEATLSEANERARTATGLPVDATGSAGLAGLVELVRRGEAATEAKSAVLFTGRTR